MKLDKLTTTDLFAACALVGLLTEGDENAKALAGRAYEIAEAMDEARFSRATQ